MTEAETILKLIETVKPYEFGILDEIDTRVHVYLMQDGHYNSTGKGMPIVGANQKCITIPPYTRSRDHLKSIRPEGYLFEMTNYACHSVCVIREPLDEDAEHQWDYHIFLSKEQKTEELAELHAIIQAIEYERKHD